MLVWTVFVLFVTWMLPDASFLFVWPLLAASGAAIVVLITNATRVVHFASWTAALVAMSVIVPAVYIVAVVILGLSSPGAIIIGLFVPMTAWLLAPHLETLGAMGRCAMPVMALLVAFLFVGIGSANARPSAKHPEPSMLAYAFDVETSRAWFLTRQSLPDQVRGPLWRLGHPHG
jgi:hypothetical protein